MNNLNRITMSFVNWMFHLSRGLLVALLIGPGPLFAAPIGEQVISGNVSFDRAGNQTNITASHNSIINYQGFNVAQQETVQFIQPSSSARVLNRILDIDPTRIDGTLRANGQVYFANQAGIFFGNTAVVDVAGIYAAAGNITDEHFLNNINHFTNLAGSVVNNGTIHAGLVGLIGKTTANYGTISAPNGLVTIVAGDDVLIGERFGHYYVKVANRRGQTSEVSDQQLGCRPDIS